MGLHEIVLPYTQPETEWVRGRALQKLSPTRRHGLLQLAVGSALRTWAGNNGEVATEWRFRIAPPGETVRPLVPDISYVAANRLRGLSGNDLEVPRLAPDVSVEILSRDDRRLDVDDKIATYLAAGCSLVVIVDAETRTLELHDHEGVTIVRSGETLMHAALPGFALSVAELFETIAPPK